MRLEPGLTFGPPTLAEFERDKLGSAAPPPADDLDGDFGFWLALGAAALAFAVIGTRVANPPGPGPIKGAARKGVRKGQLPAQRIASSKNGAPYK